MSAFCVPTPCIIPLRVPIFGESKFIDNQTRIEILCETELPAVESFFTLDGTKPQPYVNIVQGSKTYKYIKPFCLPSGKVTIKAIAIHQILRTMCSNIVTKTYFVKDVTKRKSKKSVIKKKLSSKAVKEDCETSPPIQPDCEPSGSGINVHMAINGNEENKEIEDVAASKSDMFFNCSENGSSLHSSHSESDVSSDDDENEAPDNLPLDPMPSVMPMILEVPDVTAEEDTTLSDVESPSHVCVPLDVPLQECLSCHKINNLLARYCDSCGQKLFKVCLDCKERNPGIAKFCQFCGGRFDDSKANASEDIIVKSSNVKEPQSIGILVKPIVDQRSTNTRVTSHISQSAQTNAQKENIPSPRKKMNMPKSSSGRGYWRQQLDYICNHLKAHSNNNLDFQKLIGSPPLGKFLSAEVLQSDKKVSISITFEDLTSQPVDQ